MPKIQSLIVSDFNNDYLVGFLRSNKKLKKKVFFDLKNFDNFLLSINEFDRIKVYNDVFIITQLNKIFNLEKILSNNNELTRKKEIYKIISEIENLVLKLSSRIKNITFFLWPYDTNDNYLHDFNFKKFGKNWLINFINLETSKKLSRFQNVSIIDPNFKLLKKKNNINIYDEKTKYLVGNHYSLDYLEFCGDEILESTFLKDVKKIKLIILDLDNTLWGGEAGERNFKDLEIGPNSIKGMVFYRRTIHT